MPPKQDGVSRHRKLAELERAIASATVRLTQHLQRLEWRQAAGQGTATAELLVRDAEKDLARLHRRRHEVLQAKPGE
jgi:hypothetical protein